MTDLSSHTLEIFKPSSYIVSGLLKPVLEIRDILVQIRMRIREGQKHTDLDQEHGYIYIILQE
jgi:hypothetical protein